MARPSRRYAKKEEQEQQDVLLLAERARSECASSTRALGDDLACPQRGMKEERFNARSERRSGGLFEGTAEHILMYGPNLD